MTKGQFVSSCLLIIFLFLNFSIVKSWSKGIVPVAVTEEIKEANGGEEENDRQTFNLDIILDANADKIGTITLEFTNQNYETLYDYRGTYFTPDFYSPPEFI